jgi:hypothetical protein
VNGATTPRVLVVGVGAVGQVVAACCHAAGATVALFSRRADRAKTLSVRVWPLSGPRRGDELGGDFDLVGVGDVLGGYDLVVLAVPAPLPPRDDVLWRVVDASADAVVVSFVVGDDAPSRFVVGNVGFLAFAAPLPGERASPPHIAAYFPPLSPSAFAGARASEVVALLRRGGLPAVVDDSAARRGAFLAAMVVPVVLALRAVGYSLGSLALRRRRECAAAVDAASRVVAVRRGRPPRIASLLSSPAVVGVVFAGAALVDRVGLLPMSLQTYLHVHFEKTLAQSRQLLAGFIDEGVAAGIDIAALRALQEMQSRCEPSGAQEGA